MRRQRTRGRTVTLAGLAGALLLSGCQSASSRDGDEPGRDAAEPATAADRAEPAPTTVTLAFAGDVHFEGGLVDEAGRPASTLGPMSAVLRRADVSVVNLESALTSRGSPAAKELEDPSQRYWFRSPAGALDVLDRSGVDVVSLANNHGADYGVTGLRDSLRIARQSPVAVVGVGANAREAYAPHRVTVRGTDVAVFAADASMLESTDPIWAARPGTGPGLASARYPESRRLVDGVRAAADAGELVVVYLHWGEEGNARPTVSQQTLAARLAGAGADVVVGTHAHRLLGSGLLGRTYVGYGLGNFYWYHGLQAETGVQTLRVRGDEVVSDRWVPGRIPLDGGGPEPLTGAARAAAVADWRRLRVGTGLAPGPGVRPAAPEPGPGAGAPSGLPAFTSAVRRITPALARSMRSSHDPAVCPVPLSDLRQLLVPYVGFDGAVHRGAIIVNADVATDVVGVFRSLYRARYPIRRMRMVQAYGGDDDASMAANNTSGYNCRRVAGSTSWSDHAYGRAIDINPVQNPYVIGDDVVPAAGRRFVSVDRTPAARALDGVIRDGDPVRRAFGRLGWAWGGDYADPDFQHFSAPASGG